MQDKKVNDNPDIEISTQNGETSETAASETPEKEEETVSKKSDKKTAALEAELNELKDRHIRTLAEYENYRKRSVKEKESIYTDAYASFTSEILPVLDNLERAEQFGSDGVAEGVKLILTQFRSTLEKLGVTEIKAQDEQFDPNFHNAVMHDQDEGKPANTVSEVLQKGYKIGDRVIRPSMVKVVN